jgi:hypothetical protein
MGPNTIDSPCSARYAGPVGLTAFESRRYVRSLSYRKASLAEPRNALTPKQRREVQGVIERATAFIARFELEV